MVAAWAGDCEAAISDAEKAIELKPTLPVAYQVRGLCRADGGDIDGAHEDAETAIGLGRSDFFSYWLRGITHAETGDRAGARRDFEQAIQLAPSAETAAKIWSLAEEYGIPLS
jgi:Flp pilus assembly protein TadD